MVRALKPCGTAAAYHRHLYHGEEPCAPCTEAWRLYNLSRRGGYKPLPGIQPCGTVAGRQRHQYYGEEPCAECKAAHAEGERERRAETAGS